jgi:hypothetical protein
MTYRLILGTLVFVTGIAFIASAAISISMAQGTATTVKPYTFSNVATIMSGVLLAAWWVSDAITFVMGFHPKLTSEASNSIWNAKIFSTLVYIMIIAAAWFILSDSGGGKVTSATTIAHGSIDDIAFLQVHRFNGIAGLFAGVISMGASACYQSRPQKAMW